MRLTRLLFLVCILSAPARALASAPMVDDQQGATSNAAANRVWELELFAGTVAGSDAVGGTGTLPPTRPPFVETFPFLGLTQTIPTFPSWYYGGGAEYLDRVRPYLRVGMTGVDPVLTAASANHQRTGTLGVRVTRRVTARVRGELSVELRPATLDLSRAARETIETSRAEFATFFGNWPTGSFRSVTSSAALDASSGSEIATTASVAVDVFTLSRVTPFVRVGAGAVSRTGELPRVTLRGEYVVGGFLSIPGLPPGGVAQSDTLTIRYEAPSHSFVGVIGGGLRYDLSRRLSARIEATSYVAAERLSIKVDASPRTGPVSPGVQSSFSTVFALPGAGANVMSLDFNSDPTRPSSLSGPPLGNVETFSGRAIRSRLSVTSGLIWRF